MKVNTRTLVAASVLAGGLSLTGQAVAGEVTIGEPVERHGMDWRRLPATGHDDARIAGHGG